ncbi:hypothetical protein BCV71DRAFT_227622 [Rhizopus microsporus]|uniref:Uncharacterized protein n=1 Tax=Rhizopus microsporus TaxID=58291 RepID=A0A1X0RZ19_RHIZD|nr:hypothetical protein BCV71DRAFT_227622 [Rhizopus microsporus]
MNKKYSSLKSQDSRHNTQGSRLKNNHGKLRKGKLQRTKSAPKYLGQSFLKYYGQCAQ